MPVIVFDSPFHPSKAFAPPPSPAPGPEPAAMHAERDTAAQAASKPRNAAPRAPSPPTDYASQAASWQKRATGCSDPRHYANACNRGFRLPQLKPFSMPAMQGWYPGMPGSGISPYQTMYGGMPMGRLTSAASMFGLGLGGAGLLSMMFNPFNPLGDNMLGAGLGAVLGSRFGMGGALAGGVLGGVAGEMLNPFDHLFSPFGWGFW